MQVGAKGSPERKRADEIFNFIVVPTVEAVGLEPYRADLDFTPGPITPKFLSELLAARLIIADLTGHNPNVFYELGIAHSFARPLISIVDSVKSLPFDTKDERVIELGEYPSEGLTYAQGEQAKAGLQESLKVVLADGYVPPSPLRNVAASASIDRLAPENPIAAEMAQMRETLEEIQTTLAARNSAVFPGSQVLQNLQNSEVPSSDSSDKVRVMVFMAVVRKGSSDQSQLPDTLAHLVTDPNTDGSTDEDYDEADSYGLDSSPYR